MTYRELKEALAELSEGQLGMDVTVYDSEIKESVMVNELFTVGNLPMRHFDEIDMDDEQPLLVLGLIS